MNSDVFQKKILPLADKLFRLALSITGNKQDAEDVVQDVLLKIWNKREIWGKVDNWEGYCIRSTRNVALDKMELKDNQQLSIPEHFDIKESKADIQSQLEAEERMSLLEQYIEQLPEKQRTVFLLREIEEMNYKDIALALNITQEQVKVNLFRARQKVKEYFENKKSWIE
ncbi:RNA polymerase sigma factor [Bacteroidales bacterium OttesenSCG-928-M11]|nr:RNA polymerase sigma factor [Bacteroidales bacterium OttesenSCG-928-M11]